MGSPGGGTSSAGPSDSGSPGRGSDNDKPASSSSGKSGSSQTGMTGSERTQNDTAGKDSFDKAMSDARDNRPGGPEGGDTTPGYSGPNPDPRGPALDNGPDDRQDEDTKPAAANPGDLPASDTTPGYAGPTPDPRGPALSEGKEDEKGALAMAGTVALGFAAADGPVSPIGDVIGLGVGLGILGYAGYQAMTGPPAPVMNESTNNSDNTKPGFTGEPGSTTTTNNPDGTPKQTRTYGEDGYPEKDIDYNHDHGQGQPHVHDWGRPEGGGKPRNEDRGPGRPPRSDELE